MSLIEINSSKGSYEIQIGVKATQFESEVGFLLVDNNVPKSLLPSAASTLAIDATEDLKTLATVERIILAMAEAGLKRGSAFHAIGGGVIQDLATLAASLYMRGINWHYWPTTLTGMLDSCIGGKSSINVDDHKNLVGNFYPPRRIFIDTTFLSSLPAEHILSGIAEGVKICFARGKGVFGEFLSLYEVQGLDKPEKLVELCLSSKRWFVEIDEFDIKERQLLNFGHSFGHALESASSYRIPHGIGVALGMKAALKFDEVNRNTDLSRLDSFCNQLLGRWDTGLSKLAEIDWNVFESSLGLDKKNSPTELRLVLPNKHGNLELRSIPFESGSIVKATNVMKAVISEVSNEIF